MHRNVAALLLALLPAPLMAGKIKSVTVSNSSHYDKAQFHQAVVTSEGRITLARLLRPLALKAPLDATRAWDVVEDRTGNLYVATGDQGRIIKITPDGQPTVVFDSQDSQVLSLVATADGSIYAGTGPSGLIIRIDPSGNAKVLHDSAESYVWSLAADEKDGSIYAATGPNGRILKVLPDGHAETFFQCKQNHVLCLARGADGTLYAGTDKQGLVYRIDAKGKGYVLFQAAQSEVRCLQLAGDALYAATSSPTNNRGISPNNPSGSSKGRDSLGALPKENADRASEQKTELASGGDNERSSGEDRFQSASAPVAPTSGENSVYRIGLDGSVRELFREKGMLLSLLKSGEHLYVGSGNKGQLYEVHIPTKERSEIARLESGQIQRLFQRRDGSVLIAAGDPGRLYVLQNRYAASGTLTSDVIDAKLVSRWGSLTWQADVPKGTKLTVAVRGGNVAEPDSTWSDWSAEQVDPNSATAMIPPARYAQFRVTLGTVEPTVAPSLHHLTLRYATLNQAPEVTSLETPTPEAIASSKDPKKIKFKWNATDANEDELAYDLYVRKDGWKDWVRIEKGWSKTDYEWDTTTMPSGNYQFKVVASDRPENNPADVLTGERISTLVAVAHEPPVVTLKVVGIDKNRAQFEATATSNLVRLESATFALNGGAWSNLYPTDNLFDNRDEKFRFSSGVLQEGTHVMVLRVRDAAGNIGAADVVFEVKRAEK